MAGTEGAGRRRPGLSSGMHTGLSRGNARYRQRCLAAAKKSGFGAARLNCYYKPNYPGRVLRTKGLSAWLSVGCSTGDFGVCTLSTLRVSHRVEPESDRAGFLIFPEKPSVCRGMRSESHLGHSTPSRQRGFWFNPECPAGTGTRLIRVLQATGCSRRFRWVVTFRHGRQALRLSQLQRCTRSPELATGSGIQRHSPARRPRRDGAGRRNSDGGGGPNGGK